MVNSKTRNSRSEVREFTHQAYWEEQVDEPDAPLDDVIDKYEIKLSSAISYQDFLHMMDVEEGPRL